ncbi:MAG: hypothetical protein QF903_04895 [Planctomycetota bacterium]|nr:hypothetical protein [Planctomycetota bacterium]MDP6763365.1 hypothetical protein [Planctomycetota bacterium]MDP6988794.1 hypothetical protein [Planctomycetota bacterium]
MNYSILLLLSVVVLIPSAFALAIWNSYRVARLRAGGGEGD